MFAYVFGTETIDSRLTDAFGVDKCETWRYNDDILFEVQSTMRALGVWLKKCGDGVPILLIDGRTTITDDFVVSAAPKDAWAVTYGGFLTSGMRSLSLQNKDGGNTSLIAGVAKAYPVVWLSGQAVKECVHQWSKKKDEWYAEMAKDTVNAPLIGKKDRFDHFLVNYVTNRRFMHLPGGKPIYAAVGCGVDAGNAYCKWSGHLVKQKDYIRQFESIDTVEFTVSKGNMIMPGLAKQKEGTQFPIVSLITLMRGRRAFFANAVYNVARQTACYPADRLQWVIVDDTPSTAEEERAFGEAVSVAERRLGLGCGIMHVYMPSAIPMTVGSKRNMGVAVAAGDVTAFMDDDDYFLPSATICRVNALLLYGATIAGCIQVDCYDIYGGVAGASDPPDPEDGCTFMAETSLCFARKAWEERQFEDRMTGEGFSFLVRRTRECISVPSSAVVVAITHRRNVTAGLRNLGSGKEARGDGNGKGKGQEGVEAVFVSGYTGFLERLIDGRLGYDDLDASLAYFDGNVPFAL